MYGPGALPPSDIRFVPGQSRTSRSSSNSHVDPTLNETQADYSIYDSLYESARNLGWPGWGGNDRVAKGPEKLKHILSKSYVPKHGRALELGCGEGHLCRLLETRGFETTGVDISGVAIGWAREKAAETSAARYVRADLCAPDVLSGERFDLIVDGNCLHCIIGEDRVQFLHNARRLLADDGVFFISSLCSKNGKNRILMRDARPYRQVPSAWNLEQEIAAAGFEILDCDIHIRSEHNHINLFVRGKPKTP